MYLYVIQFNRFYRLHSTLSSIQDTNLLFFGFAFFLLPLWQFIDINHRIYGLCFMFILNIVWISFYASVKTNIGKPNNSVNCNNRINNCWTSNKIKLSQYFVRRFNCNWFVAHCNIFCDNMVKSSWKQSLIKLTVNWKKQKHMESKQCIVVRESIALSSVWIQKFNLFFYLLTFLIFFDCSPVFHSKNSIKLQEQVFWLILILLGINLTN